jgi:hypothetical protein
VLLDVRAFAGGIDLSGNSNKIEFENSMEVKASTNFRSGGARQVLAGLEESQLSGEGQWEASDPTSQPYTPDEGFWASRRVTEPISIAADSSTDLAAGGTMYLTQATRKGVKWLGDVGEVIPWSAEWEGSWPVARGKCVHPSGVPRTANGSGTGYQVGAPTAVQGMYATLHVLSVTGTATPTLTVTIESSVDNTFAAPTVRGSFAAATGKGGQAIKITGPVTDQWWRAKWTISGTTPSFLFLVALGIA